MESMKIKVDTQVNEIYSKTIINQEFINIKNNPIELEVCIPNNKKALIFFHHLKFK